MKKKTILIIAKNLDGGTGTFATSLLKLNQFNFDTQIISLEKPQHRITNPISIQSRAKPKNTDYLLSFSTIIRTIKDFIWIKKHIYKLNPNTIISVGNYTNILTHFASKNPKTQIIVTIHNDLKETIKNKANQILLKPIYFVMQKAYQERKTVGVSKGVSKSIKNIAHLDYIPQTIFNGVPKQKTKTSTNMQPTIINISRFDLQKDHINLIKTFIIAQKSIPDLKLMLVGDGPTKKQVENLISQLKIKNISIFGWKNNTNTYYKKASIFLHASHRDGLPFSILEAMSFGIPVISTNNNYGPSEIIKNDEYGILVPPRNPSKMAQAIVKLFSSKKLHQHYSAKSKDRASYFSEEKMLKAYQKLIK